MPILKLEREILKSLDYEVLSSSNPQKALDMASRHAGRIDLLISDVVMPEMNGPELAAELARLYPDIKTLYVSGYTANVIAQHGVLDKDVHFIAKPFSKKSLAHKVREVLESGKKSVRG